MIRKIVFMFPGQGSQRLGMGKDLFESFPNIRQTFFEAADDLLGYKLSELYFSGDEQQLRQTKYAQPAIYTVSMALHALFEQNNINCSAVIGHSLGEFSAVAAAKGFTFLEGLQIVAERGRLMQQAQETHAGSMAAIIGLDAVKLEAICETLASEGVITIANYNGPAQMVISGETKLVDKAMLDATDAGAERVVKLPVSGAFHSPIIADIIPLLKQKMDQIQLQPLQVPMISNVEIDFISGADVVTSSLLKQAAAPVRWEQVVRKALNGIQADEFVEIGPGRVLSGLVRQLDPSINTVNIDSLKKFETWNKKSALV